MTDVLVGIEAQALWMGKLPESKRKRNEALTTHPLDIQIENLGIMSLCCWIPQHYLSCKLQSLQSQYASLNLECCNKPLQFLTTSKGRPLVYKMKELQKELPGGLASLGMKPCHTPFAGKSLPVVRQRPIQK